jgi:hypothetical protein
VLSSSERGGLDTHPEHRVQAVERLDESPRQRPDAEREALDADGV